MKRSARLFSLLCRVIDPDDFYALTVYEGEINFQGRFSPEKLLKYKKIMRCDITIEGNGYITLHRMVGIGIRIILT